MSILRPFQVQGLDPGVELLSAQFFLEMFKTGKPKGIHRRHGGCDLLGKKRKFASGGSERDILDPSR
jgi:hypothetical protein